MGIEKSDPPVKILVLFPLQLLFVHFSTCDVKTEGVSYSMKQF